MGQTIFQVEDELLDGVEVVTLHGAIEAVADLLDLGFVFQDARVCGHKLFLVEGIAEALAGFLHLFINLLLDFGHIVFDEHIGAVAFLAVAVVDERVVEGVDVA